MSDLNPYVEVVYGIPHTILLDDATAKRRGLLPDEPEAEPKSAAPTPNKAAHPQNKAGTPAGAK